MKEKLQLNYSNKVDYFSNKRSRSLKAKKIKSVLLAFSGKKSYKKCVALDFGCSVGIISFYLSRMFKSVIGLDIDKKAIDWAKKQQRKKKIKNTRFILNTSSRIPLKEDSLDVIICNHIYEHVPSAKKMIDEFYRILKKNGIVYFAASNKFSIIEPHYKLPFLSWFPKKISNLYLKLLKGEDYYENLLSYNSLLKLFRKFRVTDYSLKIIKNPENFSATDVLNKRNVIKIVPKSVLKKFLFFSPTWIFILKKY